MSKYSRIAEVIAGLARRDQVGTETNVEGEVTAPYPLFEQDEEAQHLYIVTPSFNSMAFMELVYRDIGVARSTIVDRKPAPLVAGLAEFLLWYTQKESNPDAMISYALRAEIIGDARVMSLSFLDFEEILLAEPTPSLERHLMSLALGEALSLQNRIRASQLTTMQLSIADRLNALVMEEETRSASGWNGAIDARKTRAYLATALAIQASEISREIKELEHAGVIRETSNRKAERKDEDKDRARDKERDVEGESRNEVGVFRVFRILDRDRLELLASLSRQRAAVDVTAARQRIWMLLRAGSLLSARNAALDLLSQFPGDPELIYLAALSMARLGASEEAARMLARFNGLEKEDGPRRPDLEQLVSELSGDEEVLDDETRQVWLGGLKKYVRGLHKRPRREMRELARDIVALSARIEKDAFRTSPPGSDAALRHGNRAFAIYRSLADWRRDDHYPAVNAAAMAVLVGKTEEAVRYAERAEAATSTDASYWGFASRAEACMIQGRIDDARLALRQAAAASSSGRSGDVSSTRRQLQLLERAIPATAEIATELPQHAVAAFTGHMMPPAGPGLIEHEAAAHEIMARFYDSERIETLFTALARGSDIISAKAALEVNPNLALHVVLPFEVEDFRTFSVGEHLHPHDRNWERDFNRLIARATSIRVIWGQDLLERDRWSVIVVANLVMSGLALLHADALSIRRRLFTAISTNGASTSMEGTIALVNAWRAQGLDVTVHPCGWRAPVAGADAAALELPWRLVASIRSLDGFPNCDAIIDDFDREIGGDGYSVLFRTDEGLDLVFPLAAKPLLELSRLMKDRNLRCFVDYIYTGKSKERSRARQTLASNFPAAQALPSGSVIAAERLAAILRLTESETFAITPIGYRERDRRPDKKTKQQSSDQDREWDLAPSMAVYLVSPTDR